LTESYAAGLWKDNLDWGLTWVVVSFDEKMEDTCYIGPSWSFVSVPQAAVSFLCYPPNYPQWSPSPLREYNVEVISTECVRRSENNVFGELTGGYLVITGLLKPAILIPGLKDDMGWNPFGVYSWISPICRPGSRQCIGLVALDRKPVKPNSIDIWCLFLQVQTGVYIPKGRVGSLTVCLALVQTQESSDEYRRIGLLQTLDSDFWLDGGRDHRLLEHYRRTITIV
jgi:hypothetical protein